MTTEGRLEAVVLAGGSGTRFGGGKLTAPWRGGLLIEAALAAAFAAPARTVTVVTGADMAVTEAARAWAARRGEIDRLRLVHAADHAEGMAASLRTGIAALPHDTAGALVFLGDMPTVPHGLARRLAEALGEGAAAAVPLFERERGHPVLFAAELFAALRALSGDQGAKMILDGLGPRLAVMETDDPGVRV
ncbi:MAG TPA: NTP transferase domain-containing protein, partial [Caulobacteraceae bacterium]